MRVDGSGWVSWILTPQRFVLDSAAMTLRSRLALAMMVAAVLPMVVVVGVPLLRAERRAREGSQERLDLARRQALFLVERAKRDADARVQHAAAELGRDGTSLEFVLGGPEEAARSVARALADRHGLDLLEILGPGGVVLASSRPERPLGHRSDLAGLPSGAITVFRLPGPAAGHEGAIAFLAREPLALAREPVDVVAGLAFGGSLVAEVAEITGEPATLLDENGGVVASAGALASDAQRVTGAIPLGGGFLLEISALAGDVARERRALLTAFAGVGPLALVSAFAVGILLAGRVSRPIRALADRADGIASRRAGFSLLEPESDEVRRLTASFDRMLDALSGSERQRVAAERIAAWEEVARRLAHEVKNPLSPIKLAVENLRRTREKAPAELDRALYEETATILEEVESLRSLVDEFSRFARLPRPQPVPCDPREFVEQALALFAPRIEALGVKVRVSAEEAPLRIVADPDQLGRVVKNVVANALDALEPVAERRLEVVLRRSIGPAGPSLVIEVRDSGIGLEPEALRRIFEPYFTTRGDRGGTGLGMAIAYRIVSEHGGAIEADGASGRGATITIRLPVDGPPVVRT